MKKLITFLFIALVLILPIIGCGGRKKPKGISDDIYNKAIETIEVSGDYLDGEITLEEATEKLYSIEINFEEISNAELEKDENGYWYDKNKGVGEYPMDITVRINISDIRRQIDTLKFGDEDYKTNTTENVKELRKELAEKINYK